jgi:hypothetical protein
MLLTQGHLALIWSLVLLGSFMFAPMVTHATGFDCGKAKKTGEEIICADSVLSELDDQLADDYAEAQRLSLDPGALRKDQSLCLADRDRCTDRSCLVAAYGRQLKFLPDLNRRESRLRAGEYRMEALGQHCLPFAGDPPAGKYDACQWMDLRNLGRHEGQQWYAAQYCLPQPLFPDACCTTRKALTDSMDGAILILALALAQAQPDRPLRVVLRHAVEAGWPAIPPSITMMGG